MKKIIISFITVFCAAGAYAIGCIDGHFPSTPRYICFDGRTAEKTDGGLIWNAKRGCFLSSVPCCKYDANHYGFYENAKKLGTAYARCRHDYPFRLGYMQIH